MDDFYFLESKTNKGDYKVTNTEYDISITKTVRKGKSINSFKQTKIFTELSKKGENIPDFLYHQVGFPLVSESFLKFIRKECPIENAFIETIPVVLNIPVKERCFLFNIVGNISCLNINSSKITYYENTHVIEKAEQINILKDNVKSRNIFRIKELPMDLVVSKEFKQKISISDFKSINFVPLKEYVFGF